MNNRGIGVTIAAGSFACSPENRSKIAGDKPVHVFVQNNRPHKADDLYPCGGTAHSTRSPGAVFYFADI